MSGIRSDTGYERYATHSRLVSSRGTGRSVDPMSNRPRNRPWNRPRPAGRGRCAPCPARADWLVTQRGGAGGDEGPLADQGEADRLHPRRRRRARLAAGLGGGPRRERARRPPTPRFRRRRRPPAEVPQKKIAVLTDKDFRKPAPRRHAGRQAGGAAAGQDRSPGRQRLEEAGPPLRGRHRRRGDASTTRPAT